MATTSFRNYTGSELVAMVTDDCCICGVIFAMPTSLQTERLRDGGTFYCPNGHAQHYVETKEQQLEQELQQAKDRLDAERGWTRKLTEDLGSEQRRHAATKGQLTKTRNRIHAGVCPDCHRHFENVERHMASKHPA